MTKNRHSMRMLFLVRKFLLLQLVMILATIDFHALFANAIRVRESSLDSFLGSGSSDSHNSGGFNYEIEKRVHERVSELMSVPVTMLGLVEQYSSTDVFEPPFLRPHQKDDIFRFLWTVWKEFGIDLYYGQEDGLFLGIIKGSGTYQEGRGSNGYHIAGDNNDEQSPEESYFQRLYYDKCLDRETGEAKNCTLGVQEEYVACVGNCQLTPCHSTQPERDSVTETTLVSNKHLVGTSEEPIIYCPTYDILQVPEVSVMGYIPRYYYCLNDAGRFIENDPPNSVASPSSMINGMCTHFDGVTLVDGKTDTKDTYAMADRRNYLFLGDYDNIFDSNELVTASVQSLYSGETVPDSQMSDAVFVGGHHSRRYEPRLRPWYLGAREVQNAFWTKPYPFATNNDMGISYGKPLYYTDPSTGHKVFRGVICVDYDLEEISRFLRDVFMELGLVPDDDYAVDIDNSNGMYSSTSGATVLIVEDEAPHYIIGSSTGSKAAKKVRVDDETIDCDCEDKFAAAFECKTVRATPMDYEQSTDGPLDRVMAKAFQEQKNKGFPKELVVSEAAVTHNNNSQERLPDFYVSQSLIYEQSEGENLKWRIIVAMPVEVSTNDELAVGDPMFVVVLALAFSGCLACLVLFYYYFKKRKKTEIRMSDWRFTSAFILSCALLNLTTLTYIGPATDDTCMLRMWAFHIAFVLALAPLLVKVWRIYKLVGSADRAVRFSITNRKALLFTMPAILLQALILALFTVYDPLKQHTYVNIIGSTSKQHSVCRHDSSAFTITQVIFEGGLVLVGCILAFLTRNLGSTLGEAKQLLFAMYNVALVGVIVLLMGSYLEIDEESVYVIKTVGIFWATVFSSCAFVLPRILQVQRSSLQRKRRSSCQSASSFQQQLSTSFKSNLSNCRMSMPARCNAAPMYIGDSLINEPRSKLASESLNSSDYNVDLNANQTSHSEPWKMPSGCRNHSVSPSPSFYSLSSDIDRDLHDSDVDGSLHDSVCEIPIKDNYDEDEKQQKRNTSFTKMSISLSESNVLEQLAASVDTCDLHSDEENQLDVEASIVLGSGSKVAADTLSEKE